MALSRRLDYRNDSILLLDEAQVAVRDRIIKRFEDGTYQERAVACFCGEEHELVIAERDRYGLPVRTILCPACGLLRTSPQMTEETTARFYEEDYRTLYTAWGQAQALWERETESGGRLFEFLDHLGCLEGVNTVYEVGCGAGGSLGVFQKAGFTVAGCDLGSDYLAVGRQNGVELIQGRIDDLVAHTGQRADLLLLCHVLEHFTDLRAGLRALWEAISPGGLLVIEVPGIAMIEEHYGGDLLRYLQNAHNHHFCSETLCYVLEATGFEILDADQTVRAVARKVNRPLRYRPSQETPREVMRFLAALEKSHLLGA